MGFILQGSRNGIIDMECSDARVMFGLDRKTHRYFIEPLRKRQHIKWALIQRFLNLTKRLKESPKTQLSMLYQVIRNDCRSTTGRNIRRVENIFHGKPFEEIRETNIRKKEFVPVPEEEKWRIPLVKELIEVKYNQLVLEGFSRSQIDEMVYDICTTKFYVHYVNLSLV